jgi:hypothetical protein
MTATDFGEVLKRVEYFGGIELMYHTDLSRVQRNLNELPHEAIEGFVPRRRSGRYWLDEDTGRTGSEVSALSSR